jgi:hypothetical protein
LLFLVRALGWTFGGGEMTNSSFRKKAVSGWLKQHHTEDFTSALKLQKFLFFYEGLSKIENDLTEFRLLRGYINGPVFSDVYGDYTHEKDEFAYEAEKAYLHRPEVVNEERAKFAGFLVSIMNEHELSGLTHEFNIWRAQEKDIKRGVKNVPLREEDFNEADANLLLSLKKMYPISYIDSVEIIEISGKCFIIDKVDLPKFTEDTWSVFISLANEDSLQNPVYVSVSEEGVVMVD